MNGQMQTGALDRARIFAAVLVVAIHTGPLSSIHTDADFLLTRVLARLAVPLFFMMTGYFSLSPILNGKDPDLQGLRKLIKSNVIFYSIAAVIYLPVSIYAGHYTNLSIIDALRLLIFDGVYYHLWYFPALILGAGIVCILAQRLRPVVLLVICVLLYLIGLGGDSYFGLAAKIPMAETVYMQMFTVFSYTRNGLFFAPLFLAMGAYFPRFQPKWPHMADFFIFFICLAGMGAEAWILRITGWPRHDSMYLLLPPAAFFLMHLLLALPIQPMPKLRRISAWVYILHPLGIIGVRFAARLLHARSFLLDNSLVYFFCTLTGAFAAAWIFTKAQAWLQKEPNPQGRAWVEIDMHALAHNIQLFDTYLPEDCSLMPVLKADAYGHGAIQCAKLMRSCGIDSFCVACIQEGIELRRHGIGGEILILGYTHPSDFPLLRRWHLTQTVLDRNYAQMLQTYGRRLRVHLALDTGMHRLGIPAEEFPSILEIFSIKNLCITGIYSHLCTDTSTQAGKAYLESQIHQFRQTMDRLIEHGIRIPKQHLLASDGILNHSGFYGDAVRPGILLYGAHSAAESAGFLPVLCWKARVAAIKILHPGESAGYHFGFTAVQETRIAILSVGYADGLPRELSKQKGCVLLCGQEAPILGWICMDQTIVDVSAIPAVKAGAEAVLIGRCGRREQRACDLASQAATIPNELLSRIGVRCQRIYR